jgi:hypothetical protein
MHCWRGAGLVWVLCATPKPGKHALHQAAWMLVQQCSRCPPALGLNSSKYLSMGTASMMSLT